MYNKEDLDEIINALQDCYYDCLTPQSFEDNIVYPFMNKYKKNFDWAAGASKGVLIFKQFNFVIKIPFEGIDWYDEEEEEFEFIRFSEANDDEDYYWNYCFTEENIFKSAIKKGLKDYFAGTKEIMKINFYPIYIQPFAIALEKTSSNHSVQEKQIVSDICKNNNFYSLNLNWLVDVLNYFGKNGLIKILTFIKEYEIGDLHDGNIGYIGNKPVLIDYSDYKD